MDHSNRRMQQHHKRQRVAATTETTVEATQETSTSINTRLYKNRTATELATTTETPTTAVTTAEETTPSTVAEDDEVTSAATQNTRNRGGTTTSNPTGSPAAGFNSATAINATPKNNESSSSNGGAIAGAIIAVIAVLAIAVGGYFVYRRRKNAKAARGSGTGLIGGAGGGGYKKQDEGNDSYGGNDGTGTFGATRDNSSLFGGREKTFSAESIGGAYGSTGGGGGGGGNNDWTQPTQQSSGPPASQYASWNTPVAYPPSNQPLPASTANLLSNQPQSTSNLVPASLAAGAAGIGATRLLQQQQSQPHHHSTTEPFSTDSQYQSIEQRELQQELDNRRESFMNKTQPPPPVPQVSQQPEDDESSPFGESEGQGEVREVKGTFDPSLDDELVLYPGDKVQVLMKYDDGWALGLNLSSGTPPSKGVFPFDCLGDIVPPPNSSEIRSASSSTPARSLSPINPANIPLPPPTPTLLSPIGEDDQPPQSHQFSSGPPQLAPFERSDSPLSPDFPPSVHHNRNSLMLPGGGSPVKANGEKLKRHSSLIASRDADLFVALGEVLDKEKH
ncbi:hypothetical protein JCM5353_002400 [Sporobolomyces roseus]